MGQGAERFPPPVFFCNRAELITSGFLVRTPTNYEQPGL